MGGGHKAAGWVPPYRDGHGAPSSSHRTYTQRRPAQRQPRAGQHTERCCKPSGRPGRDPASGDSCRSPPTSLSFLVRSLSASSTTWCVGQGVPDDHRRAGRLSSLPVSHWLPPRWLPPPPPPPPTHTLSLGRWRWPRGSAARRAPCVLSWRQRRPAGGGCEAAGGRGRAKVGGWCGRAWRVAPPARAAPGCPRQLRPTRSLLVCLAHPTPTHTPHPRTHLHTPHPHTDTHTHHTPRPAHLQLRQAAARRPLVLRNLSLQQRHLLPQQLHGVSGAAGAAGNARVASQLSNGQVALAQGHRPAAAPGVYQGADGTHDSPPKCA